MDTLKRLARWYEAQCDDEWEHGFGIHIATLDNPGWSIQINLDGTPLESRPFDRIEEGEDDDNFDDEGRQIGPWLTCCVKGRRFHAACGPHDLERALRTFLDWTDAPS